jgi:hypothetical protein
MSDTLSEIELVKAVFSTRSGKKLLDRWEDIYFNRSSYEPGRPVEDTVYFEGQRSVILSIKQMLEVKIKDE